MTWLEDALAYYGKPRIAFADARLRTDLGSVTRTGWAWFPDGKNLGTHIDRASGSVKVTAWSHARGSWVEIRQPGDDVPDEQMRALLTAVWGSDWTRAPETETQPDPQRCPDCGGDGGPWSMCIRCDGTGRLDWRDRA